MPRKVRLICSVCDAELGDVNAAPTEVADIRYVSQPHRGCGKQTAPPKAPVESVTIRVARAYEVVEKDGRLVPVAPQV